MRVLVTGTSGHLGEALASVLPARGHEVIGLDLVPSSYTEVVGSICDAPLVRSCMNGVEAVIHTATLHKPHLETHSRQDFVDTNITGTLTLLEATRESGVQRFVLTSTTSLFGMALVPPPGGPTAWITEEVQPIPKNIYGATKRAAEELCWLCHLHHGMECVVLRTSRFFPEPDDNAEIRARYHDANIKVNELLYRRVDIEDAAIAHALALEKASFIGFGSSSSAPRRPSPPATCRNCARMPLRWFGRGFQSATSSSPSASGSCSHRSTGSM